MNMKRMIRKTFESATPDVLNRVKAACALPENCPTAPVPESKPQKNRLPYWLTENLAIAGALAALVCVIGGGAWLMSHGGFAPSGQFGPGPTIPTTQPTETTVPTQTTTPAQTTTPPTTAPVETTVPPTQPTVEMTDDQYAMSPDGYRAFVFDGIRQPITNGPEFDLTTLTANCLYVYDEKNEYLTQLCEKTVICYDTTYEHIYYLDAQGKQIVRSDYTGAQQEVLYTSDDKITWFDYYGTNAAGVLCVVENSKSVIVLNLETGEDETLMEQHYVEEAYYDSDSLDYTSPDKGATILWHGKVSEDDEFNTYLYYVETGELEDPVWH